jgi:hypothetical protein
MTTHAENPLRSSCVSKILNLALAIPAAKAGGAEGLVSGKNCQVFNLISTRTTAVCAVIADERSITEKQEIRVRVEKCSAGIAPETIQMPSIASCNMVST